MKNLIILIMLCTVSFGLFASDLSFGLNFGPNVSNLYGDDSSYSLFYQAFYDDNTADTLAAISVGDYLATSDASSSKVGFVLGLYCELVLKENASQDNQLLFRPELNWNHTRIEYSFAHSALGTGIFDDVDLLNTNGFVNKVTLNNIEIPLLLRYSTKGYSNNPLPSGMSRAFFNLGPVLAFSISEKSKYSVEMQEIDNFVNQLNNDDTIPTTMYTYTKENNAVDDMKSMGFGIAGGIGWEFMNVFGLDEHNLSFELRTKFDLSSLASNKDIDTKLYSVTLMLGYPF